LTEELDFKPNFNDLFPDNNHHLEEYGRFQQHTVLLEDSCRVSHYAQAIAQCAPGEIVVDVGSGTGLLGICALKSGFSHAFLIEPSKKMCEYIKHFSKINGVENKITILNSTLEALSPSALPQEIDLVVTETISSVLYGFGCWDAFPDLLERVATKPGIIPSRGDLYCCLATKEFATRGSESGGIAFLKRLGLKVDIFERTFRSGGNIYDKPIVQTAIDNGELSPFRISSFDFNQSDPYNLKGGEVKVKGTNLYTGLVLYWDVLLADKVNTIMLSSLTPALSSWYPYYVSFKQPITIEDGETLNIRMAFHEMDMPYKYAFQFFNENIPLTHILYW